MFAVLTFEPEFAKLSGRPSADPRSRFLAEWVLG